MLAAAAFWVAFAEADAKAGVEEAPGFAVFFILTVKSFFGVRRGTVFVAQANVYPTVPGEGIRGSS